MDLRETLETTGTTRFYLADPVPDAILASVLDAARYAPSGGNRQPVRFVAVRDSAKKRALRDLYLPIWDAYSSRARQAAGEDPARRRLIDNADHFARHLDQIPILLVVCAVEAEIFATDRDLGRLSVVGGASVYPAVQNVLLKAREEGLGTALTTLLCSVEPAVKQLLRIPSSNLTAAMVALGYPARGFPKKLKRRPLRDIAFLDEFGKELIV